MSWSDHTLRARWLVVRSCAPQPTRGQLLLSEVSNTVNYLGLARAIVPDLVPDNAPDNWVDEAWERAADDLVRQRLITFLEWLIRSDATASRHFLQRTSAVLSTSEAFKASGLLLRSDDPWTRAQLLGIAQRVLHEATKPGGSERSYDFTESQEAAFRKIATMVRAYFAQAGQTWTVKPRLHVLAIGPTGVGKSSLMRAAARNEKVSYLRTSVGEWVPLGVKDTRPTVRLIVDALIRSPVGLVLCIDELDKAGFDQTPWSRSSFAEIFAVLDREFPPASLEVDGQAVSRGELEQRIQKRLFIGAAGTWQHLWRGPSKIGFAPGGEPAADVVDQIAAERTVPRELLMRFAWPPIVLTYPTAAETTAIFERSGLFKLAKTAGITLDPNRHDWSRGGMRTLESIAGELLVRIYSANPNLDLNAS